MFSLVEKLIIIIDPVRIFYGFLVLCFVYFAWRSDRPIPIIIVIRRNRNTIRIQRIPTQEVEDNDTEVEDINVTPETDDTPEPPEDNIIQNSQENGPEEIIRQMDQAEGVRKRSTEIRTHHQEGTHTHSQIPDFEIDDSPDSIKIKLKFFNDNVKTVQAKKDDSIMDFKKKFFKSDLQAENNVKLIYRGHILVDTKTIEQCSISDNSVVHCLVTKKKSGNVEVRPELTRHRNFPEHQIILIYVGMFLVTCTLLFCWFCRIQYSYLFSTYSTIGLGLMTSLFLTMVHLMSLIER